MLQGIISRVITMLVWIAGFRPRHRTAGQAPLFPEHGSAGDESAAPPYVISNGGDAWEWAVCNRRQRYCVAGGLSHGRAAMLAEILNLAAHADARSPLAPAAKPGAGAWRGQ